jgi:hypothetical protein
VWRLPLDFWRDFWDLVGRALTLDGRVLLAAPADILTYTAALALAGAAGISLTLGHSVLLFANRVPRGRFVATLLVGALVYLARIALWTVSIWLVGLVSPRYALSLSTALLAVCFGQVPQLFAFLVMLPYVGPFLRRALDAYSLVVVVAGLRAMLDISILTALATAGLGWLLQAFLNGLLERPLAGVRTWVWRTATGQEEFTSATKAIDARLDALQEPAATGGPAETARPAGNERAEWPA